MVWIAGVDGFKSQWCVVLQDLASEELRVRIVPTFVGLLSLDEAPTVVADDIPLGLPEYAAPDGRACEREARRLLRRRASSVFSAVGRAVLSHPDRPEANRASRIAGGLGVGAQAWGKNCDRLQAGDVAHKFLAAVLAHAKVNRLLSTEHQRVRMPTVLHAFSDIAEQGLANACHDDIFYQ